MLQGEHSAILSTFIKLPFVIKIFVLSILVGCFTQVYQNGFFIEAHSLNPDQTASLSLKEQPVLCSYCLQYILADETADDKRRDWQEMG